MDQFQKNQMVITQLKRMVNGVIYTRKTMPNMESTHKKIFAKKISARGSIYKKGVWAVSSEQRFINSPHPCYNSDNENL